MRKVLSIILLFLGSFLLVGGLIARFWVPGQVEKTPLDINSVTRLTGDAQLFDGTALQETPVKATSVTHSDTSKSDDSVVVMESSSCLVKDPDGTAPDCVSADDPDKRLVSAGTDVFATDRVTALAVNDSKYLPADAKKHEGLINKFPFHPEKSDYKFWDGLTSRAVPATFQGEEDLDGVTTHKYVVRIIDGDITIGEDAGKYSTEKTMWVDALTGSILKQSEHQTRSMASSGQTVLDLTFAFTPDTVAKNVEDAKANASKLNLLTSTVPLVGLVGGVLALFGGFVLRQSDARTSDGSRHRVPVGA